VYIFSVEVKIIGFHQIRILPLVFNALFNIIYLSPSIFEQGD
jgi:hypothetical protein